ncbi:MAG: ABC transporter ATP-binding protein [Epulopiscium sp.]|nr:ABC transporter ATP-binding protein [Candidatus Epulonipiscium sp.]
MAQEVLRMDNITKIYDNGFVANKNITFWLNKGEILALVGENGAGKTTLMKVLFGLESPQSGSVYINGEHVKIENTLDAIDKGIGMVHQHFMLLPSLTVAENVALGIEPMKKGLFDFNKAVKMTQEVADKYRFNIDPLSKVEDLSVGQMQKVEIMKVLIRGAKIIIMDEPTAVLTPQETDELFEQLLLLKEGGHSIIFISHKLEEVKRICSRVTVLRHGYCLGSYELENMNESDISRLMVGRDVVLKIDKEDPKPEEVVVKIKNLVKINETGKKVIDGISFDIRKGEVVGIAGVEGNGQSELSDVLCGMDTFSSGEVKINNQDIAGKTVHEIRKMGLAYIPEDRMRHGCAPDLSIKDNIISDRFFLPEYRKGLFIKHKYIDQLVDQYIKDFEIACDDKNQPVRMLSGGNIQKVVVAREFTSGSNFILANQPTRGIDVGAAEMIRKTIVKKSRTEGTATLLISADLNEVLECSDRLLVMRKGKVVAAFPKANEVSEDELGEYMLGIKTMTAKEMENVL